MKSIDENENVNLDESLEMLEEYKIEERVPKKTYNFYAIFFFFFLICLILGFLVIILTVVVIYLSQKEPNYALEIIYNDEWNFKLQNSPELASIINDKRFNSKLTNYSMKSIENTKKYYSNLLDRISPEDDPSITWKLFKNMVKTIVENNKFPTEYMNIDQLQAGPQIEIPSLIRDLKFETVNDYTDFIQRLSSISTQIDERITLLNKGIETGYTRPKITLISVPSQIRYLLNSSVTDSVFYSPFKNIPTDIPGYQNLQIQAQNIIINSVLTSYSKLLNYMENIYIPNSRNTIAASDLPNGKAFYKQQVSYFTTTTRTPDEIHNLGLSEVARIIPQMQIIINSLNFTGTFKDFIDSLKTDTRFYAKTEEEFLMFIRDIAKRSDPQLPKFFSKIPRCPYGVRPIDPEQAKTAPAAYYNPPNMDCSRPGYYYVNTYDLTQRPKYVYESTTLHETVPGHHFQLAIANELQGLPKFRTVDTGMNTAFVEGWALYSESLGDSMGFYTNPYFKFGSLGDEILRACRLVVDTGMHWKGWTRDQAIQYMKDNTPLSELDIVSEIDRYITWPGQALAYKSGELKIKELREKAKIELGVKFDIREFHDKVLENGSLPLDVLEEMINEYIRNKLRPRRP